MRQRQGKGEKKKKREWKVGDNCRAVFSEDGVEYEGSVVFCNRANKSVTVRFFGYNNEEEVREVELMESLGQAEVEAQVEQARLDMEEEEEEGAGDEYRTGDWCRAEWSEDGVVYEAEIVSVNRSKNTAEVKFVGFGNKEVKNLDELFMSKGEERREQQEEASRDDDTGGDNDDGDIDAMLIKNCPDLLRNFGEADLNLEKLNIDDKKSKKNKKEKKEKKEKEDKKSKTKVKDSDKGSKVKQEPVDPEPDQIKFPNPFSSFQPPLGFAPPPLMMPAFSAFSSPINMFPPHPMQSPSFPPAMSPHLPQPPSLPSHLQDNISPELHSMLMSWYMAGYNTGVYQGVNMKKSKKK